MKFKSLILATSVLFAACQNVSESESTTESGEAVVETPAESSLSNVRFKKLTGEEVTLGQFSDKVVFLNFWATWCGPCIREMPSLQAFYNKYQGNPNVEFLVVEIDNKPSLASDFIQKNNFTFPIYSPAGELPRTLLGESIPTTVIIDKKGEVAHFHEGMSDFMADEFVTKFEGILSK